MESKSKDNSQPLHVKMNNLAQWLAVFLLVLLVPVHTFFPNLLLASVKTSGEEKRPSFITHKYMTKEALKRVASTFIAENKEDYPFPADSLGSASFKEALENFLDAVALPDTSKEWLRKPSAHFDAEKLVESNQHILRFRSIALDRIRNGNISIARSFIGQALHTLQDFYSHTNWIEMDNTLPHPGLGVPGVFIGEVASTSQATCVDCEVGVGMFPKACYANMRSDVNDKGILTSGYSAGQGISKPAGKCSHGGWRDVTTKSHAMGGINKDSNSEAFSPHSYLHEKAAEMAELATVNFLNALKSETSKTEFAEFLGLPVGTTLCFVVDTTGSMSEEIAAVRDTAIRLTRKGSESTMRPSDYLLAPFNDPGVGPLFQTTNASAMIAQLRTLVADGGDDEPELAWSGILLAVNNVRPGSTCYFFTDASAKDMHVYPTVQAIVMEKRIRIDIVVTTTSRRRKRRSLSRSRQKRSKYPYYDELSRLSGGTSLTLRKSDIAAGSRVIDIGTRASQVNVMIVEKRQSGFKFHVDSLLSDVILQVSTDLGLLTDVSIRNKQGRQLTDFQLITSVSNLRIYNLSLISPGLWTVNVTTSLATRGGGSFSASVTARSALSFGYRLATPEDGPHPGYATISGPPIENTKYSLVADISGAKALGSTSETHLNNVTSLLLVSLSGDVIQRLPLYGLLDLEEYVVESVTLPQQGFRVAVEGFDSLANIVQRWDQVVVVVSSIKLVVVQSENDSLFVLPGSSLNMSINLTSVGQAAATWFVRISDSAKFYTGPAASEVSLVKSESRFLPIRFNIPADTRVNDISAVTVSVGGVSQTDIKSSKVFYITVVSPAADSEPPSCVVVEQLGNCAHTDTSGNECDSDQWSARVVLQDSKSGLKTVRPATNHSGASFAVDLFVEGSRSTVNGLYRSTCCNSRITIVGYDVEGNVGTCVVDIPLTSPQSNAACLPRVLQTHFYYFLHSCVLLSVSFLVSEY